MEFFKIFFIYLLFIRHFVRCQVYDECKDIGETEVLVASKKSCAKYVFCDGENSYEAECLIGYHFNEKTGSCDHPINVKCDVEPSDSVESIFGVNFSTTESVKRTTNRNEYIEIKTNASKNDIKEIESDENGMSSSTEELSKPSLTASCSQLKGHSKIMNIANAESCVAFYTCYNGNAISMLCPSKMYFNEISGKCESQMPQRCKAKYSVRLNCLKGVYDFVPHPTRCEYYFYCVNGYLMIMRCPNNFTWHYERGTCVHKSKSQCFAAVSQ